MSDTGSGVNVNSSAEPTAPTQPGIVELMEDLGMALASGDPSVLMLGGGNPARIPDVERVWRSRMESLLREGDGFDRMVGHYDPPQGPPEFLEAVAAALRSRCGWPLTARNVALTGGSQSAFFLMVNSIAKSGRRVCLPYCPEYIGYADLGLASHPFVSGRPLVELHGERWFKYRVDFDALPLDRNLGAIALSRPSNPTGNVATDDELRRLDEIASARGIPLIIDGAYGPPFPNILHVAAQPMWNQNVILTLSLSKLGLPGTRTGIVIASEARIRQMARLTAISSLATGSLGPALVGPLLASGQLFDVCRDLIRPFYAAKLSAALAALRESIPDHIPWRAHVAEGGFFLWLWFPGLPIASWDLYRRLKARGVLVVSGHYFFFGGRRDDPTARECLRVTYAQTDAAVRDGLRILGDELRRLYDRAAASRG